MKLNILIIIMIVTPLYSYGMFNEHTNNREAKIEDEVKAMKCIKNTDVSQLPFALEMSGIQNFDCDISQSVQGCVLFEQNKYNRMAVFGNLANCLFFWGMLGLCITNYNTGDYSNDASKEDDCMDCEVIQLLSIIPGIVAFVAAYKIKDHSRVLENIDNIRRRK